MRFRQYKIQCEICICYAFYWRSMLANGRIDSKIDWCSMSVMFCHHIVIIMKKLPVWELFELMGYQAKWQKCPAKMLFMFMFKLNQSIWTRLNWLRSTTAVIAIQTTDSVGTASNTLMMRIRHEWATYEKTNGLG